MLIGWVPIILVATASGFLIAIAIYYFRRCSRPQNNHTTPENMQSGIARLQTSINNHKQNYQIFRKGVSTKPLFNWADNPSLVTDAVENGWSRFAFMSYPSSPSTRSTRSLLGVCTTGDQVRDTEIDMSWEVCQGSADFMQKIRLNSGLKMSNFSNSSSMAAVSVIKTALPLPGPLLGNTPSFPQEAYFEITVLSSSDDDYEFSKGSRVEGEKIKLIHEDFKAKSNSDSIVHITGTNFGQIEEMKTVKEDKRETEGGVMLSVGLTGGGSLPLKLPGGFPGSIGFNSNGSVFLDGIKVMVESEIMEEWGRSADTVIGCGYSPSQRKVFFTMDSDVMHEFTCKSEEFGTPMYPTLAANSEVTVIVNFGQRAFKYLPANVNRTSNPCFIGPLANSSSLGYEDSKELFSMGRIDSQWLHASATKSANDYNRGAEFDDFSEGDLFEIVLESSRTPKTPI